MVRTRSDDPSFCPFFWMCLLLSSSVVFFDIHFYCVLVIHLYCVVILFYCVLELSNFPVFCCHPTLLWCHPVLVCAVVIQLYRFLLSSNCTVFCCHITLLCAVVIQLYCAVVIQLWCMLQVCPPCFHCWQVWELRFDSSASAWPLWHPTSSWVLRILFCVLVMSLRVALAAVAHWLIVSEQFSVCSRRES